MTLRIVLLEPSPSFARSLKAALEHDRSCTIIGHATDSRHALAIAEQARPDAVVVSVKWNENDVNRIIDTIRKSGVKRALFVVGAGSLIRKDGRTHFDHMMEKGVQPPTSKPAMLALDAIRAIKDLEWTAVSPAAAIPAGTRTGKFRRGLDQFLVDSKGESRISREDFAIAIVDEIEKPKHIRKRFTAAY